MPVTVSQYLKEWTEDPVRNVLAGMVGTFALIPEVIAFSYAAGVAPEVGLYASLLSASPSPLRVVDQA